MQDRSNMTINRNMQGTPPRSEKRSFHFVGPEDLVQHIEIDAVCRLRCSQGEFEILGHKHFGGTGAQMIAVLMIAVFCTLRFLSVVLLRYTKRE